MFEELENDLRDVNSVKGLAKVMLANGIENINVDKEGIVILVTPFGLLENVPQSKWEIDSANKWNYKLTAKMGNVNIYCDFNHSEAKDFAKATGFVFPEVDADESK